jgi:hypothetical protein
MNKKTLIIFGVVIIALSVLASVLFGGKIETIVEKVTEISGVASNYSTTGGVETYGARIPLKTSTTTICAIQSPNSTSTLVFASVDMRTSSTSAGIVDIARATTAYATTTRIGGLTLTTANTGNTILASTTPTLYLDNDPLVFPPSNWLVVKMIRQDKSALLFSPVGTCEALWNRATY